MAIWVCATCGNHYPAAASPPAVCAVCADERQWVPPGGQRWTTLAELAAAGHRGDVREVEPGLTGIGTDPPFAIGQRALLLRTPAGNLLWDPPGFVDGLYTTFAGTHEPPGATALLKNSSSATIAFAGSGRPSTAAHCAGVHTTPEPHFDGSSK